MLEAFLTTHNLLGYVDGSIPCPNTTISSTGSSVDKDKDKTNPQPNPNYATWVSNDAHVRMLIMSTVSEASFQHVQGNTSRELWLSLARAYAPQTSSREYTLKTQLLKLQMKGDETSSAYLNRAQEYSDALANIGEPVKEKDLVMLVISGLRDEYNGLKSTILGRQHPTAFSELQGLFSDYDYMIKKPAPEVMTPVQAFMTATNHSSSATPTVSNVPSETLQALQQLVGQLGLQLQPISSSPNNNSQASTQTAQATITPTEVTLLHN